MKPASPNRRRLSRRRSYRRFTPLLAFVVLLSLVAPSGQGMVPTALASPQNPGCYYPSLGQVGTARASLGITASTTSTASTNDPAVTSEPATPAKIEAQFGGKPGHGFPSTGDAARALDEAGYPADVRSRIAVRQAAATASGTSDPYPSPRPITPEEKAAITALPTTPHPKGAQVQAGGVGAIVGQIFNDSNGDGSTDGEFALQNMVVDFFSQKYTDNNGLPFVFRTTTNASGQFGVSNWPAGDYVAVYAYVPIGRTVSTYVGGKKNNLQFVTVPDGLIQGTWPIGFDPVPGVLAGHVFADNNGNGVQAGGEANKAGIPVYISSWEDNNLQIVLTDSNGNFAAYVPYGNTTAFTIEIPALNTVTTNNAVQLGTVPRNAYGYATPIGLDPTTGTAAGRVFDDANGNGTQDGGESGKANVTIYMLSSDYYLRTTTTNASGDYSVTVPYGAYSSIVVAQVPGNTFVTSPENEQYISVPRAGTGSAQKIGLKSFSGYGANSLPGTGVSKVTTGINDAGVVIGSGNGIGEAFIYLPAGHSAKQRTAGVVTAGCGGAGMLDGDSIAQPLDAIASEPDAPSDAVAVNDSDAVVGSSRDDSGREQATVWSEPDAQPVNPVANQGYSSSEANDINNDGRVVGDGEANGQQAFSVNQDGTQYVSLHNFLNNQIHNVQESSANAINDQQIAVGSYTKSGRTIAFAAVSTAGNTSIKDLGLTSTPLNDYPETEGKLINNQNQVVIEATKDGKHEVWLHTIPGSGSGGAGTVKIGEGAAVSINNAGQVVWDDVNHTRHVYDIKAGVDITPLIPSGTKIWGINNKGQGVGDSADNGPVLLAPLTGTRTLTLTVPAGNGTISASPAGSTFAAGTIVTITANGDGGRVLQGWKVNGQPQGWVNPLKLSMSQDFTVEATFTPLVRFNDVPSDHPAYDAISQLATRGYVKGYEGGLEFGPLDPILRSQMAALIGRAMGYADNPANPFTDKCDPLAPANCVDDELWNRVAQLASRNVARGYTDAGTCAPAAAPCYAARDNVLKAQAISFITRAMVAQGYWAQQPTNASLYGGILNGTGHEQDVTTFVHYAGLVPQGPQTNQPWGAWNTDSSRGWFALALWQALDSYWGH